MVNAAESSIGDVDLVLYLIEPKAYIGEGDKHIIELLNKCDVPVILLINKIDSLEKKEEILPVIDHYSKAFDFKHIIPVSARTGYGLDDLKDTIFKELPSGPLYYDEDTVTELPEKEIVSELIREQALKALSEEVPHGIAVIIDRMKEYDHITDIDATIICEKDSHKGMIIGKGGSMLKTIGSKARREIEDLVEGHVNTPARATDSDTRKDFTIFYATSQCMSEVRVVARILSVSAVILIGIALFIEIFLHELF